MADYAWLLWMALAALFIIGEIFTAGFFILWFGIAALVAGVLALLGFGAGWQWGSFIVISLVLFLVSRRFAERFTKKQPPGIGADRFINKEGLVLEKIDNAENRGRVRMDREEWRAQSESGESINVGAKVKVSRIEGTHLIVTKIKENE